MIRKFNLILLLILPFTQACKKDRGTPADQQPSTIEYNVINREFYYDQHLNLDVNHDGTGDVWFTSVLLMDNNKPYLYLNASPVTESGSKLMIKQGTQLAINSYWAYPLDKNFTIGEMPAEQGSWTKPLEKSTIINSSRTETSNEHNGLWLAKQNKYLAFQVKINGQRHYGWIRLSHNEANDRIIIHDYAYNKTAGVSIKAGQQQ